ncbi:MAG TPA: sulfatase, partial [Planctomycetaceae bacterium]|nr:sulfatase [Planctomycetaceae bacterium]
MASMSQETAKAASLSDDPLAPKQPHFPARAKNVILLFMGGGPSQFELFDYKPTLEKLDGTLPPADLLKGYRAAFINPNSKLLGPKYPFAKHGESGAELSDQLPHLAKVVDDLCIIRSMKTDAFNHAPGQLLMSTGSQQFGRPSMGSWVTYGLGNESRNLPSYIVFNSGNKGPSAGSSNWSSGFLPTVHSGVEFRTSGDPVLYLSNP